jgi:four helix bundle protein
MTAINTPEAVALMQLAKTQANRVEQLLQHSSLLEDTGFYKEIQGAAHSVLDCLMEAFNKNRAEQFQKNFLVVAKTFNSELRTVVVDCFGKKHIDAEAAEALMQANSELENALISFLRKLQGYGQAHKQSAMPSASQKIKHNT